MLFHDQLDKKTGQGQRQDQSTESKKIDGKSDKKSGIETFHFNFCSSNLYPIPLTVFMKIGFLVFSSIFSRK